MGGGLGNLCLGYFADIYGRQYSWIISGIMMVATALTIYYIVRSVENTN
jgi:MFS family permease